jgi:F-type H+-transporting ATPase subunit gamma
MVAASRCARRRSACARRGPMPTRSATSRRTCRRPTPSTSHPFMRQGGDAKAVGFIVVTTDKGLCGGLNTNMLRAVTAQAARSCKAGGKVRRWPSATRAFGFLNRIGANVCRHAVQLGDAPQLDKLIGPVKVMLDAYVAGKLDEVYLCYTRFINTMKQEPVVEQLLPLSAKRLAQAKARRRRDGTLGLHLRARRATVHRRAAGALHRGAGLPGGGREHGLRAVGAHGGHEGRTDNAGNLIAELQAGLQQDPPGRDHQGTLRDRRRRGGH